MKLFVTGISTDVGKTIASAIITEALQADYWKPVQAGDLAPTDSQKVQSLISNSRSVIHPNSYCLKKPASPHLAALAENIAIDLNHFEEPITGNHLVVEGAGGLLVPLNDKNTVIDLIHTDYQVVIVSRHYLGSINHTLLTIEALNSRKITIAGIIFNSDEPNDERDLSNEKIILAISGVKLIGKIQKEPYFDKEVILEYADLFREKLQELI